MMNIQQVMKQAQDLQKKMTEIQQKLAESDVVGVAGGGLVSITTSGKGDVKKVKIDKSLIVQDEVEILEDLIIAAFNSAKQNSDIFMSEEMKKLGVSPEILKGIV